MTVLPYYRVLVTGSRHHQNPNRVWDALDACRAAHPDRTMHLVVGDCPTGADKYARAWAKERKVYHTVLYADWDRYGKSAGPRRNRHMVDAFLHNECLAFYQPGEKNKGTRHCADYAKDRGIPVTAFDDPDET